LGIREWVGWLWRGVVVGAGGGFVEWSARACVSRCAGVVVLGLGAEIRRLRLRVVLAELEDSSESIGRTWTTLRSL
jgi:hypothetical protein